MAKKDSFNIFNAIDESLLDSLKVSASPVAPTEKEVELIKTEKGDIRMIPISKLNPYHNHTFKVLDNEDMAQLVDSIRDYGIILPIIVREQNGGTYEIVSGHRRHFAAKKLGLEEVPCKIMDLDDDMADIVMADTNIARETILPSEKARTYKVRLEAAIRQGKQTEEELRTIADESPDSLTGIRRYLKLNSLSPALLNKVDDGSIPLTAGVTLAGFSEQHQQAVAEVIAEKGSPLTIKDVEKLKKAAPRGLTRETVESILNGNLNPRAGKKKAKTPVFKEDMLSEVVPKEVMELPLEDRVEYYKAAIKAYAERS